jgi:23S rRNA pseudouridine1911/1915/1917 synthase
LAATLRTRFPEQSWNAVRRLCETGKVRVDDAVVLDPSTRIAPEARVDVNLNAPKPRTVTPGFRVEYEDAHLIVIEKPAGTSSVPYERKEAGTALDLIRAHWRSGPRRGAGATTTPLYTVHRLDKETSGLLCFAKTRAAERGLHEIFQQHLAARSYLAVAHGTVAPGRIESRLIPDRGDGLRGSTRDLRQGQHAVTHVEVLQHLAAATLCRVRLETGRTHQIRIHLSEAGHPIVGDAVYTRDLAASGRPLLPTERMMLHAATLGFAHPVTARRIELESAPPPEFLDSLARLGGASSW